MNYSTLQIESFTIYKFFKKCFVNNTTDKQFFNDSYAIPHSKRYIYNKWWLYFIQIPTANELHNFVHWNFFSSHSVFEIIDKNDGQLSLWRVLALSSITTDNELWKRARESNTNAWRRRSVHHFDQLFPKRSILEKNLIQQKLSSFIRETRRVPTVHRRKDTLYI